MANQLDGLVALFNAWMMSIGKQSANTVDHFALLHSGDGRHKRIVMLSDCVWSPRCQIFTRCHLPAGDRDTFSVMPVFPFRFTIGASRGSCRLGGQGFCLWLATSDELAMQLLRDAPAWDVIPLVVVPDTESRSLRDCIATDQMDKVLLRTAERARAHTARDALRDAEHAVIKLDASCPDAASAAASAMPLGILAGASQRELVCPRFFDEDGLGDLRGDVSGTCTPLVESDLEALFDDCEAAIGAKAEDELLASPVEGDGAGAALSSSSSTDLPSPAPARPPAPRPVAHASHAAPPHHELDVVREDHLAALLDLERRLRVRHRDHARRVARLERRAIGIPGLVVVVLDAEGFHLEAHDAREVGRGVAVVQDGEAQVVVQEVRRLRLALRGRVCVHVCLLVCWFVCV